jgi:hypothetical protein
VVHTPSNPLFNSKLYNSLFCKMPAMLTAYFPMSTRVKHHYSGQHTIHLLTIFHYIFLVQQDLNKFPVLSQHSNVKGRTKCFTYRRLQYQRLLEDPLLTGNIDTCTHGKQSSDHLGLSNGTCSTKCSSVVPS